MRAEEPFFIPGEDFQTTPGDEGRAFRSYSDIQRRTPGSRMKQNYDSALEKELIALENAQADQDYNLYLKHRDNFETTSEKIYFLSQRTYQDKTQYLQARGYIQTSNVPQYTKQDNNFALQNSEVLLGMSKDEVSKSWGRPLTRDIAGNPSHENERWAYQRNGVTKYIYFEHGRVEGWSEGE